MTTRTSRPVSDDTRTKQRIVDALRQRMVDDATGAAEPAYTPSRVDPQSQVWLGLLAAEEDVQPETKESSTRDDRSSEASERFRPASQGFSFKTRELPVTVNVEVGFSVWVTTHPSYEQQLETLPRPEDSTTDPGTDDAVDLARIRTKIPVGPVSLAIELMPEDAASPEPRHAGRAAIAAAVREAVRSRPAEIRLHRPLRRPGGQRPRWSDLRTPATWSAWEEGNLGPEVHPEYVVEVDAEVGHVEEPDGSDAYEVLLTVVNRSPGNEHQYVDRDRTHTFVGWACDTNIYEVRLRAEPDAELVPYRLHQIPDNFRYDRTLTALGWNSAVVRSGNGLETSYVAVATTERIYPRTAETDPATAIDVSFETLSRDPLPALDTLVSSAEAWFREHWSEAALDTLAAELGWDERTRSRAAEDAAEAAAEVEWITAGLARLRADEAAVRAFRLMNETMKEAARGRYDSWRPFQVAFILGCIPGLLDPDADRHVDILWFPTGGGKTEAYLGLNAFYLFYQRLAGYTGGVNTWARFPLRLLSLQQTQRFADSVLTAEMIRRRTPDLLAGDPFAVGYFVGSGNTPNEIRRQRDDTWKDGWDPHDRAEECRVLERCPGCGEQPLVRFDEDDFTMEHFCESGGCPLAGRLPVYVIDDDIERRVPSVVVGTVDKLTKVAWSAGFRHFLGVTHGVCPTHGLSKKYPRCAVFPCEEQLQPVRGALAGLGLEIQDEMHLLSEALGSLDGNFETLAHTIGRELTGRDVKIVGATATIEGYEEQSDQLYRRSPRRFPLPGPRRGESFWAFENPDDPLRTYVAALPRGTTMLNAAYWVTMSHRRLLETALEDVDGFCAEVGIDPEHRDAAERFLDDLYWVFTTYALRHQELTRYRRDLTDDPERFPEDAWGEITGNVDFSVIRETLDRLENPARGDLRVVGATAAISHGVDIDRLNVMCVMGMPNQVAEFIQATARVGRTHPGLVYCLINPYRRRDVSHFRYFPKWAEYLDKLVERVPVNREALPVLDLVLPGGFLAWLRQIDDPAWLRGGGPRDRRKTLWFTRNVEEAINAGAIDEPTTRDRLARSFAIPDNDPRFDLHRQYIERFVDKVFRHITAGSGDPRTGIPTTLEAAGYPVPRSLRDVEKTIRIRGEL